MSLSPLLAAGFYIKWHGLAAMAAFVLGLVQFFGRKGTTRHRILGYGWAALMLFVAASSFRIQTLRVIGPWSPIHILSAIVLVTVPLAVWAAHRHQVARHRRAMISLFAYALLVAGLFTLLPGRIMHAVVFGS